MISAVLTASVGVVLIALVGCATDPVAPPVAPPVEPPPLECPESGWPGAFVAPATDTPTHAPVLRRIVPLEVVPTSAPIRLVGLGDYQLHVNGRRVTAALSNQPWSQYDRRVYWREYDLAPYLSAGDNAIEVQLGASWWYVGDVPAGTWIKSDAVSRFDPDRPYLLGVTSDEIDVSTDTGWEWAPSSLVFTHILGGEHYDARARERTWRPATLTCAPAVEYAPYDGPLLVEHEVEDPVRIVSVAPDRHTYYFANNTSAFVRFTVEGAPDQRIALVPSEVVTGLGQAEQLNLHGTRAAYEYVLRGDGPESHEAQFFYHGFQYVRLEGAVPAGAPNPAGLPVVQRVQSVHVRTANREVGAFSSSSPLYDAIHEMIDWSFKSNSSYVLTDCPHREKLGWLETAYLLQRSLAYRYDLSRWYAKIAQDVRDAQMPDGLVRNVAPYYLLQPANMPFGFTVEWGAAAALLPWEHYRAYGDRDELRRSYASMRAFVDYLAANAPDRIAPGGLGDWYDYGHGQPPAESRFTPPQLSATATFALSTQALIKAAEALGETADVARYRQLLDEIRAAFWARFYDPVTGQLRHLGSPQTAHAMALEADLVPAAYRAQLLDAIVADLATRAHQQTSGDIGHVYLIRALARAGRSDVLHTIYSRTGVGSYGGILAEGLTTLPETWDARVADSLSLNHAMLGHVMEWLYGYVAGIRQSDTSIAWSEIEIGPEPGPLRWASATLTVPRGTIRVHWTMEDNELVLAVTIPPGPPARATLPPGQLLTLELDGVDLSTRRFLSLPSGDSTIRARYRPARPLE